MKLEDLMELVMPEVEEADYKGKLKYNYKGSPDPATGYQGKGMNSAVRDDRTDPHMVRKHHMKPFGEGGEADRKFDGFSVFIDYLIENDLIGHVNFPKVYNVKKIKDDHGHYIYKYTMEKLVESSKLSTAEIAAFIEHNFVPGAIDLKSHQPDMERGERWDIMYKRNVLTAIAQKLRGAAEFPQGYMGNLTNETLQEALFAVNKFLKTNKRGIRDTDLNSGNFMFRRTPVGVQIVLTDPIF